ncbi:hypothetical protein LCGC14_0951520 [marine sediment metagenome]|uniref:AMP-dependent synthetase/ligase domain-containing protein n=1 Tax=marine sediment metagenome TaxID=412755 RepID=A0A0F9P3A7_9ZZZZ
MSKTSKPNDPNLIDVKEFGKKFAEWAKKHGAYLQKFGEISAKNEISWGSLVEENAQKYPNKTAIKFEEITLTYKEFNEKVNQYTNYFISLGLKKGDISKVLIKNRIEFLLVYTANAKIGVISSLINTDLKKKTLEHCLNLTPGKIIVIGEECFDAFRNVQTNLNLVDAQNLCYIPDYNKQTVPEGFINLPQVVKNVSTDDPSTTVNVKTPDVIAYLFTSGTTGLPKAARLTHTRVALAGMLLADIIGNFTSEDTMYISLPFFHGTAIMTGWSSILAAGGALALSRKFSASRFWDDIRKFKATAFNYVGEICRYLMNLPPSPEDSNNSVRVVIGNGLRPEIWKDFKKRFDIPIIGEFYGSSEGNVVFANILNFDCTLGYSSSPYAIVKYDVDEEQPLRDDKGFMNKVRPGEIGLLIGKSEGTSTFAGYTEEKATEAKLLRNVFQEGDAYFNTGDLVRDQGSMHAQFIDRLGDTYRWKGHNVSTTEVEQVLNLFEEVSLSSVYGVKIANTDGRAGMAAVVPDPNIKGLNFKELAKIFEEHLAPYAIPIFLRLKSSLSTTHSFKFKKVTLKKEGFNPEEIEDPIYIKVPYKPDYIPLSKKIYERVLNHDFKL